MATFIGVALGVPAAIYLNRRTEGEKARKDRVSELSQFADILQIVTTNIEVIIETAHYTGQTGKAGEISSRRCELDTWDALSKDVLSGLARFGPSGTAVALQLPQFFVRVRILESSRSRVEDLFLTGRAIPGAPTWDLPVKHLDACVMSVTARAEPLLGDLKVIKDQIRDEARRVAQRRA